MSVIKLTLPEGESAVTGKQVSFVAPCDCTGVTGIKIGDVEYTLVDALGKTISELGSVFCSGAIVSVLLDCTNSKAYMLNACTASVDIDITPDSIGAMPKSGGTFTGMVVGASNANHTAYQLRNIALSTSASTPTGNGSLLGVYS